MTATTKTTTMILRFMLSLLLLNCFTGAQNVSVGPFVDTDTCYGALSGSDCCPKDDLIDRQEYVTFVQLSGPDGFLENVTDFSELPVILQLNFNALACLCTNVPGAADDCCIGDNARINITGVDEGQVTPYLFSVCLFTDTSINRVISSNAPSAAPTIMPSSAPSLLPGTPTMAPTTSGPTLTAAPSLETTPDFETVMVPYPIAVQDGLVQEVDPSTYTDDLIAAMNIVATNVALSEFRMRRRQLRSRRLAVMVRTPTSITGTIVIPCPDGIPDTDECREVNPVVILEITDEDDPAAVRDAYEQALTEAIFVNGDLQTALTVVNPNSVVRILSPAEAPTPAPAPDSGISGGGIAGIVIAASVVTIAGVGYFVFRRKRAQDKDDNRPYMPSTEDKAAVLGAGTATYGKGNKRDTDTELAVASAAKKSDDSSSNAGSSGWSSSAGVSSLNSEQDEAQRGASLAAMGVASARSANKIESGDVPDLPTVTRADLDSAIDSGDWAAVGATAALLAAASDSQSHSSKSRKSGTSASRGGSSVSSIDAARAAELDHLVDAGDWEGVVLAAARFEKSEGESSTSKSETGSKNSGSQSGSATRSGTAGSSEYYTGSYTGTGSGSYGTSSGYSQGETTSLSDSPSKQAKRAEIRNEVEALVRRVVPDEIDNVDEMMLQFRGREEELVETLRTMQERSIAQRARAADRKSAKIQARDEVRKARQGDAAAAAAAAGGGGDGGLSGGAVAGIAAGAAVGGAALGAAGAAVAAKSKKDDKDDKAKAAPALKSEDEGDTSETERKRRRTALEEAIDAGDWEAVGEAAAMMSDASVTTASSRSFSASLDTDASSRKKRTGVNAERAAELDALIDKGDWTGVMAAAGNFSKTDREGKSMSSSSPDTSRDDGKSTGTGSGSGSGGSKRRSWFGRKKSDTSAGKSDDASSGSSKAKKAKALKEEQDALAQAEVWMQIAEQSKAEGSTEEAGASDAADWAIARSLSALRHAEAGGELKGDSVKKPADDEAASTGDKSV